MKQLIIVMQQMHRIVHQRIAHQKTVLQKIAHQRTAHQRIAQLTAQTVNNFDVSLIASGRL